MQLRRRDRLFDFLLEGRRRSDRSQQQAEDIVASQPLDRFDQELLAAIAIEARGAEHHMTAIGYAQVAGELNDAIDADLRRIETVEIDAGRDRVQAVGSTWAALAHVARDVVGNRDHCIGLELAPFGASLHEARRAERAVQGCDTFHLEAARQAARDPTGDRRARLDDVHVRMAEVRGEPRRQAEARRERAAPFRQVDMRGTQPQQVGQHRAAGRGDDCAAAVGDHGLRRIECRARKTATGERRHDLEKGDGRQ